MSNTPLPKRLLQQLTPHLPEMLSALRLFTVTESPSLEKVAVDRCCAIVAKQWRKLSGAGIDRVAQKHRGDHLRITWTPAAAKPRPAGQLLVLGHYDTVYASGVLRKMPFRISGGKAYGPGTFDMKAGIVQALFAAQALQHQPATDQPRKRIVFLWTSDEEIGSESSRRLIETEARRSDAVFVLEPSFGLRGALKTERKGVGEAELIVHGRASHAGLAPQDGINAIHEISRQIARLETWNDLRRGITINAGTIEGGTRTNVIPERASVQLDLRATTIADMRQLERRLYALRPELKGARLEITGGFSRAPLERKMSAALFARAKSLASEINLTLNECAVGGGSDGNFTAAAGIPTLDGLGAVGDGAHSIHEHVIIKTMPQRAALLAALLQSV
ncbi:MAG TPA: M20 family metallopeptidase [Candidatus Acidoferrum sp.]|jgi:glutamate carboxypeptidase